MLGQSSDLEQIHQKWGQSPYPELCITKTSAEARHLLLEIMVEYFVSETCSQFIIILIFQHY